MAEARGRLRRVRRVGLWVGVAFAVVALTIGSFVAGRLTSPPIRDTIEQARAPIPVDAEVEMRLVDSRASYVAMVQEPAGIETPVTSTGVVVRAVLSPGQQISPATLLGVIEGQPSFALPEPLALYRDLNRGDEGDDVLTLQRSLAAAGYAVEPSGVVGSQTLRAMNSMFRDAGFDPLENIPFRQLMPLPSDVTVTEVAAVGTMVSADHPLFRAHRGAPNITMMIDSVAAGELAVGQTMSANIGGATADVVVIGIGSFVEPTAESAGGREVVLQPSDPAIVLDPGDQVTVFGPGESEEVLAVPLVAVRQDNEGTYVLRETTVDGKTAHTRTAVEVLRSGAGWAAIAEGELSVGEKVRVTDGG